MRGLIAEVGKLERLAQLGTADQRNGFLQIIALLAGDAHFIALDSSLHLELGILDKLDQLLGHLGFDTLLHLHLLGVTAAGVHYVTHIQAAGVDIALEHFIPQDIQHLLELEIGIRGQLDGLLGELVGGLDATEIETGLQFAIGIIHRILHFIDGDFRNDVKRGHGHYLSVQTKAHNLAEKPATLKWSPSAKAVLIKGYFMTPRAYRLLLLLILALMFWRALGPFDIAENPHFPHTDKWVHSAVFTLLLACWVQAFPGKIWQAAVAVLGIGALIEVLQIGTHHTPSVRDWLADLAGVSVYLLLHLAVRALRRQPGAAL